MTLPPADDPWAAPPPPYGAPPPADQPTPYGQSQSGQSPYGQSPYGQSPYGQPGGYPGMPYSGQPFGAPVQVGIHPVAKGLRVSLLVMGGVSALTGGSFLGDRYQGTPHVHTYGTLAVGTGILSALVALVVTRRQPWVPFLVVAAAVLVAGSRLYFVSEVEVHDPTAVLLFILPALIVFRALQKPVLAWYRGT